MDKRDAAEMLCFSYFFIIKNCLYVAEGSSVMSASRGSPVLSDGYLCQPPVNLFN